MVRVRLTARKSCIPFRRQPELEDSSDEEVDEQIVVEGPAPVLPEAIVLSDEEDQEEEEDPAEVEEVEDQVQVAQPIDQPAEAQEAGQGEEEEQEQQVGQDGSGDPDVPDAEASLPADPPQPEIWTTTIHRHDGGDAHYPSLLKELLEELGIQAEVEFIGKKRSHPIYPDEWEVTVHINIADYVHGGRRTMAIHSAISQRATFAAGIEDAARKALDRTLYDNFEALEGSTWEHFPHRARGASACLIENVQGQNNPRLSRQAKYTAALNSYADNTSNELRNVFEERAAERLENKRLRAALQGDDPDAVESDEEECPARSPPRRRTRLWMANTFIQ